MPHKTFKSNQNTLNLELLGSTEPFPLKGQHWPGYSYLKVEIYAGDLGGNKTTKM